MHQPGKKTADSKTSDKSEEVKQDTVEKSTQKLRSEADNGARDLTQELIQKRQEQKALRQMRLTSQFKERGMASVGEITRQFGCSIELANKRTGRIAVPGRSSEDLDALTKMEQASNSNMLMGNRGKFVPAISCSEPNNFDAKTEHNRQLYDPTTRDIHIGKQTYSADQVFADLPQEQRTDAVGSRSERSHQLQEKGDRYQLNIGTRTYISREDGTVDKFVNEKFAGTARNSLDGQLFKMNSNESFPRYTYDKVTGDLKTLGQNSVIFEDTSVKISEQKKQPNASDFEQDHPVTPMKLEAGSPLKGEVRNAFVDLRDDRNSQKSDFYYTFALGIETPNPQGDFNVLVNLNIGNRMEANGTRLMDGQPHRQIFLVDNVHWRWIDATVQATDHNSAKLTIHRMSPFSKDVPPKDANRWREVNSTFKMSSEEQKRQIHLDDYRSFITTGVQKEEYKSKSGLNWTEKEDHVNLRLKDPDFEY